MMPEKQMSASQPLVFLWLSGSRIRAPHSSSCFAGYSFANDARKTNVCFAAACFSLASLYYTILRPLPIG